MSTTAPAENEPEDHTFKSLYLLYHEICTHSSSYSYVVDESKFEQHLDLFQSLRTPSTNHVLPEITFDDGHLSDFTVALPKLLGRGLTARFFITVGWIGTPGYMAWSELQELHGSGQMIGSHGWTHTLLTHCTRNELTRELVDSRSLLEDKLGAPMTTVSLPGGRSNAGVLAACTEAGYESVFTSTPELSPLTPGPLVGRVNVRGEMDVTWLSNLLSRHSSLLATLQRQERRKAALKSILGDAVYERLWALVNRHTRPS